MGLARILPFACDSLYIWEKGSNIRVLLKQLRLIGVLWGLFWFGEIGVN